MAPRTCRSRRGPRALLVAAVLALGVGGVGGGSARAVEGPGGSTSTSVSGGKKLFFRGSIFSVDQSTTPETLSPGLQLSHLPSTQTWVSLRPRFHLTDTLSLRLRADLTTEWLNGVDTTKKRQPMWGDIWSELMYSGIPTFGGVKAIVGVRALWPTSLLSQLRGFYVQLGAVATLARDFNTRIGGFGLSVVMAGTHPFARSTSGGFLADGNTYACMFGEIRGAVCDRIGSAMNSYFNLTAAVSARYSPIEQLSLNLSYVVIDSFLYDTPDATLVDRTGGVTEVPRSAQDQRFRQASWFSASLDYDATSWLGLSAGYYVVRPIRQPDNTIGNPFWSPGGNSRLFFSLTFTLDQLYQAIVDKVSRPAPSPAPGVALADPTLR